MVLLSLSHSIHDQTVIIVDGNNGNDTICHSSSGHPCKTLDVALSVVNSNNVIVKIYNGTYYHNATLNSTLTHNGITITGNSIDTTIIKCNDGAGFGFRNVSNICISELTMSGCGELRNSTTLQLNSRAALYFFDVINVTIDNVAVINSNGMGIAMYDVTGNVIINNSIFKNNNILSNELYIYPGQRNLSMSFQNNTNVLNKSATFLSYEWKNLPESVDVNSSSLDLLFNQMFRFVSSSGPSIGNITIIDAINITIDISTPQKLPPGKLYKFYIIAFDELGNVVKSAFFVQTLKPEVSVVVSSTGCTFNNQTRLHGRVGSRVKLYLGSVDSQLCSIIIETEFPLGFYRNNASDVLNSTKSCPSTDYYGTHQCHKNNSTYTCVYPYIWAGNISRKGESIFVTADCPEGYCNISIPSPPLPVDLSNMAGAELENKKCLYRNSTLCGKCITGYYVATNSFTYKCVNSASSQFNKHGVLWLIILKYIPFTIFLFLIIFFNVSLVDGPLNSFILFTQIIDSVGPLHDGIAYLNEAHENKETKLISFSKIYYFLYGPWNANYFEILLTEFYAFKFDSTIKVLMLEYIPALYPLVLFVLFYSIIPCITNCLINSERDMPRRCLLKVERMFIIFRRTWSIRSSIIHGLTTFLVLSYAKVITVTGLLLSSTTLYGCLNTEGAVKIVVRLDGTMEYFGKEHFPYACVALILFFTIVVLPPLLLLSYPLLPKLISELNLHDKWLLKILIMKPLNKCIPFFDAFQSCFKNRYRYFAGLYFLYRVIAVALITFQWQMTTRLICQQGFFLLIILIHCVCQPYKLRKYNILDGCIFVILAAINSLSLYNVFSAEKHYTEPHDQLPFWIQLSLIYVPFMYFIVLLFYYIRKRCALCINKVKQMFCYCLSKCGIKTATPINTDETPARLLDSSSSSSSNSSSSEEEDNPDNEQDVLPVEYTNQSNASVIQSPHQLSSQNRLNRFTT